MVLRTLMVVRHGGWEDSKLRLEEEICEISLWNSAIHITMPICVGDMLVYWKIWVNNESTLTFLFSLLIEFCLGHWKKVYFISNHLVSHWESMSICIFLLILTVLEYDYIGGWHF